MLGDWRLNGWLKIVRKQAGFTLLEVLVAVGILGIIGTGFITALDSNSRATRGLDEQTVAVNLASDYLEVIKELPYAASYPTAGANITPPSQYSVNTTIQCSSDGTNWGDTYSTLQKITVKVSREGRPVLSLCTYRTQ